MIKKNKHQLHIHKEVHKINASGVELALHAWVPTQIDAAIFYFHGLQSHAGWLWETGAQFASKNIAFFVLDRRGCGISHGSRSELAPAEIILDDYSMAISYVKNLIGEEVPLSLFGHCLGGSFLAALLHYPSFTAHYDSAIFCSAWLGKLHRTLTADDRLKLMQNSSDAMWDSGLKAADFTDVLQYQHFIEHDTLAIHAISQKSRKVLLDIESMYIKNNANKFDTLPLAYISGEQDPIIDLTDAHNAFSEYISDIYTKVGFSTNKHYLLFTNVRNNMINWVHNFILFNRNKNCTAKVA